MSRGVKLGVVAGVLLAAVVAIVIVGQQKKKNRATEVRIEKIGRRDLVAAVTASGKIQPKTKVDISADITGRILDIAVKEGDLVKKGQFLIQIDPAQYQAAVSRAQALVASSEATLIQVKATRAQAERAQSRTRELAKSSGTLISPEAVEQSQTAYEVAVANYSTTQAQLEQSRAGLQEARDNLRKTRLIAPISGRVTRLAVEVGEVAVPGTFSKETALLMTVADLSVILAKVQVDETDVVRLALGDSVQVAIDAFPDTTFVGRVTKISNSAKLTPTQTASGSNDRAVDFDVEVTLTAPPAEVRPDLSCTARMVTDTRKNVASVPIIALTVRNHEAVPNENAVGGAAPPLAVHGDTGRGMRKKEKEGVFVVRDGLATFRPVKVGIAGDEFFEVVDGVREGEEIVAGTYQAIRDLKDSTRVKQAPPTPGSDKKDAKPS